VGVGGKSIGAATKVLDSSIPELAKTVDDGLIRARCGTGRAWAEKKTR
jgi:hypothetical protein